MNTVQRLKQLIQYTNLTKIIIIIIIIINYGYKVEYLI